MLCIQQCISDDSAMQRLVSPHPVLPPPHCPFCSIHLLHTSSSRTTAQKQQRPRKPREKHKTRSKDTTTNTATNTTTTTPPTTTMQMPLKCMVIVGSVMATILLQLVHPSTFQTHHNSKENQMKTAKTWTAHDLGAIALEKKMALVVSKIVGSSSNESEFSTNLASSRRRWGLLLMYDT